MIVWRLVLRDSEVIDFGAPWKDPDGTPAKSPPTAENPAGAVLPLRVGGIFLEPEQLISGGEDDEELLEKLDQLIAAQQAGSSIKELLEEVKDRLESDQGDSEVETHPACYLVFARPEKGSPLEESKETRVRRIPIDMVKYAEEAWGSDIASAYIAEALSDMYNLATAAAPSNGASQQQGASTTQP